jgi:MraZ protein
MFLGEYGHSLDGKGRLFIPAKYRPACQPGVVVTRGFERCLYIYTNSGWQSLVSGLENLPPNKKKTRSLIRFLCSGATDLLPDAQCRILLPAYLREFAGLHAEVTVIGAYDHLEVWAADEWPKVREEVEQNAEAIAEETDFRFSSLR